MISGGSPRDRRGAPSSAEGGPRAAAAYGIVVLAAVGLVANDSSVAVPATMLIVVVPVLLTRELDRPGELRA